MKRISEKLQGKILFRNSEEAVEGELRKSSSSDFWKSQKQRTGTWKNEVKKVLKKFREVIR